LRWSLRWQCSGCFSVNGGDLTILQDNQVHYRGQLIVGVVPRALKLPASQQVSCAPTTRRRHNTEVRADPRLYPLTRSTPGFPPMRSITPPACACATFRDMRQGPRVIRLDVDRASHTPDG
jgi:hypothetical protein